MTAHRKVVIAIGALVTMAACLAISRLKADQAQGPKGNSQLVSAADEALQATMADYNAGQASVEDIYQWSRRLMDAELLQGKKNAAVDHANRMRDLHKQVDALHQAGARGGSTRDYRATLFYSLEANSWLTP